MDPLQPFHIRTSYTAHSFSFSYLCPPFRKTLPKDILLSSENSQGRRIIAANLADWPLYPLKPLYLPKF